MAVNQSGKILFNGAAITATTNYVYNAAESSAATSGWIDVDGYNNILVQVCVATLTASALTYRIEGKWQPMGRAAEIYTEEVTATQLIDELIEVSELVASIRIGVKSEETDATPNNFHAGVIMTEMF